MKRFVLDGHVGFFNRGCEAILTQTVGILRATVGEVSVVASSYDPEGDAQLSADRALRFVQRRPHKWTAAWWALKGLEWSRARGLIRRVPMRMSLGPLALELDRAECVLHIGGDNYSLEGRFPYVWMEAGEWALARGKPYVLWAASLGPGTRRHPRLPELVDHLRRVTLITAREPATIEHLAELGVSDNVRRVADPAVLLQASPASLDDIMPGSGLQPRSYLALNVSPFVILHNRDSSPAELLAEYAGFVRQVISRHDLSVVLVPHVTAAPAIAGPTDPRVLKLLQDEVAGPRVHLLPVNLSAAATKRVIAEAAAFVGARTHSVIAALSSCVPAISLSYSLKANGINRDFLGHDRYVLAAPDVACGSLLALLAEVLDESEEVRVALARRLPELQRLAYQGGHYLAEVLCREAAAERPPMPEVISRDG